MSDLHELVSGKPKGKRTVIRLSEEVQASESVDTKTAHAMRIKSSSHKKRENMRSHS